MEKTSPIAAFQDGEIQSKPIYLGFCKSDGSYWFYALKDNVPRFLRYVTYFHWDRGPQEILEMKPLPSEVESELKDYLEGKLGYEFRKLRKNSKAAAAFKVYRLPEAVGGECEVPRGTNRSSRSGGGDESGGSVSRPPSAERKDASDAPVRRRRSGKLLGAVHQSPSEQSAPVVPSAELAIKAESLPDSLPVTPEPKRRGRSSKKQVVPETTVNVSSNVAVEEVKEQPNVTRKRSPRKQPQNGLELGVVELLTLSNTMVEIPIKKKRGRPRKVAT